MGLAVMAVWLLGAVSACAGTEVIDSGGPPVAGSEDGVAQALTVEEFAPSLAFFGDLAVVRSEPVITTFDAAAGSLELGEGVTVEVPAGAFDQPTDVTSVIVDLDFGRYAQNPPETTAYVLSTEAAVDLGEPLVLEVPIPADAVRVIQLIDTQWQLLDIVAGPTTRIPIAHFSENLTVVTRPEDGDPLLIGDDPESDTPADFLRACIYATSWILRDGDDFSLSDHLAYSFCTRALVTKYSPSGVRVEVSCVGNKIGGEIDFQGAIDACVAENESADTSAPSGQVGDAPTAPLVEEPGGVSDVAPSLAEDPAAPDSGMIPDGVYVGSLLETGEHNVGSMSIIDESVEFTVAEGLIDASVGFTVQGTVRVHNGEPVCSMRLFYEFAGSGAANSPLVLKLEPQVQEVFDVEGEDCGSNEQRWRTTATAEESMRAAFGRPVYLDAEYIDAGIEGTLTGAVEGMPVNVIAEQL